MEEEWSFYRGGQFNGGRMVMLQVVSLWMENGHITEVGSFKEREWSFTEVVSLMEENGHVREWPV